MSLTAALIVFAQAATGQSGSDVPARSEPIAVSATASVEILAPTIIRFASNTVEQVQGAPPPQQNTDSSGRNWIEFS